MSEQEAPIEVCRRQAKLFTIGTKVAVAALIIYVIMYLMGAIGLFFKPLSDEEMSKENIFSSSGDIFSSDVFSS